MVKSLLSEIIRIHFFFSGDVLSAEVQHLCFKQTLTLVLLPSTENSISSCWMHKSLYTSASLWPFWCHYLPSLRNYWHTNKNNVYWDLFNSVHGSIYAMWFILFSWLYAFYYKSIVFSSKESWRSWAIKHKWEMLKSTHPPSMHMHQMSAQSFRSFYVLFA